MTLRIAGAASAPRLVLMRVRRSRRRSLIRYLLMAAPGDRVSGSPEVRDEVYHIPAPARCGEAGRDPASSELLQVLHQQQAPLRPQDLGKPGFMACRQGLDPHQRFLSAAGQIERVRAAIAIRGAPLDPAAP